MIIAHFPAGYLAARALWPAFDQDRLIFWSIIAGAVAPDLDLIWFFLVDGGATHHHTYLTHDPTLWIGVLLAGFALTSRLLIGLGIGTLLHLALDTFVGAVSWGYGRFSVSGPIVDVPVTQEHWVLSFVLHWTFLAEVVLWGLTLRIWLRTRRFMPKG